MHNSEERDERRGTSRWVAFLIVAVGAVVVFTGGAKAQSTFCEFDRLKEQMQRSDPATYQRIVSLESDYRADVQRRASGGVPAPQKLSFPDTIYLVVHVIHLGEPVGTGSNISDNRIIATIDTVNRMYAGAYGGVNTNIVFMLACQDTSGNSTTGIVRVNGSTLSGYSKGGATNDPFCSGAWWEDVVALSPRWDPTRYVNVYVAHELDCGSGVAGWTYLPTGVVDRYDVVFVKDDYFTSAHAFVLAHELGHYLGLYHTFEGDNSGAQCPPNSNCSTDGDKVCDTAPHKYNDCDATNDCGYNSQPMWNNTRFNYMSYCHIYGNTLNVFTHGQRDRMDWFLLNAGDRNQLLSYNPPCAMPACSITIVIDSVDTACAGTANGAAYVTVTGCQGTCHYLWSTGATTQDLLGVPAGTYTLEVTDDSGCVARQSVSVPAWPAISASANITYPSCRSCTDGAIDITVSGGVPPYAYLWSTGATTQDISGIDTGTYTVTITDARNCTQTFAYYVGLMQPCQQITLNIYYWDTVPSANLRGFIWPINERFACTDAFHIDYADIAFRWLYDTITDSVYSRVLFDSVRIDTVRAYIWHSRGASSLQYDTIIFALYADVVSSATLLWLHDTIVNSSITGNSLRWYALPVGITIPATDTPILRITMRGSTLDTLYLAAWYEDRCNGNCYAVPSVFPTSSRYWLNYPGSCQYFTDQSLYIDCNNNGQMDAGSCELFPIQYWAAGITATAIAFSTTSPPIIAVDSVVNVSCTGRNDGAVYVSVSEGQPPLSYWWTPGNYTTEDITGLFAGTYTLVVTDACGRRDTISVSVGAPPALVIDSFTRQNPSMCGASDGWASVYVSGGTPPYTYQWTSGHTTQVAMGLSAGTYQVTVTDAKGCRISGQVTLNDPPTPTATYIKRDVGCAGGSDGWIKVTPSGGTPSYTHRWNPIPPNSSAAGDSVWGLYAGTWTDTIIDARNCTHILQVPIIEPLPLSATADSIDSVSCAGGSDGAIYITVRGGTPPYRHRWSTGDTTEDLTGIPAGTYTDTITDANGCTMVAGPFAVADPRRLAVTLDSIDLVSCAGGFDGAIYITVSGGTPPYRHRWSTGATTEDLTGIRAGTYTDTITDANGCTMVAGPFTVEEQSVPCGPTAVQQADSASKGMRCVLRVDDDVVRVLCRGGHLLEAHLLGVDGREVAGCGSADGVSCELGLSAGLASGVYILRVVGREGVANWRVVLGGH